MTQGDPEFDYIIIGGGTAGCVLASRLSENLDMQVALLEGGVPYPRALEPPMFVADSPDDCMEKFLTMQQPGLNNRKIELARGTVLGGGSSVNAMLCNRGHRAIYDQWDALGNTGWSYDEVLPFFKKSEDFESGENPFHGSAGPHAVSRGGVVPLCEHLLKAFYEMGFSRNEDFNGLNQEGMGYYQVHTRRGRRESTAVSYLRPAEKRGNVSIFIGASVNKIVIDNSRAVGVEFFHEGHLRKCKAGREIILTAGAINSPKILMLSGIGPASELRPLGITVNTDLPGVGKNLQDHVAVEMTFRGSKYRPQLIYPTSLSGVVRGGIALAQYYLTRGGPISLSPIPAGGFIKTENATDGIPDLQLIFAPSLGLEYVFALEATVLNHHGKGSLRLDPQNPMGVPHVDPQYLLDTRNLNTLVFGLKLLRQVCQSKSVLDFCGKIEEMAPGLDTRTDIELGNWVRNHATTTYHYAGTCKMGPDSDPMAVVDHKLKVKGIENLRVADASIMPKVVTGNTCAPTIMIGERAASFIKGE